MKENKIFAVLSGVLLIISSIFEVGFYTMVHRPEGINVIAWIEGINVITWIAMIIPAVIGVTLLVGRINVATVVTLVIQVIIEIIDLIEWFSLNGIIALVIAILLLICGIMVISKNAKGAKILGFIPVGLFALKTILGLNLSVWLIWDILVVLSYVLFALYINSIQYDETKNVNPVIAKSLNTAEIGKADKLLQYKELLDAGIISQEEFDEKKKQLLG